MTDAVIDIKTSRLSAIEGTKEAKVKVGSNLKIFLFGTTAVSSRKKTTELSI